MFQTTSQISLCQCHGKTIALKFSLPQTTGRVVCGIGSWAHDKLLGNVLRIRLEADEKSEVVIADAQWRGEILPDEHGCDYAIQIA